MLLSYSLFSTKSLASKESEVLPDVGQITFKETALMTPNLIARRSKKGDNAPPGKAPHCTRQWLGQNALVCRTNVGLAPSISETEITRRKISIDP
jgi:hypothetical protein